MGNRSSCKLGLVTLLATALVLGSLVAGCGGGSSEPDQPLVFTYALSSEPDSLDPSVWFTTSPLNLNVYQGLLEVNPPGSKEPFTPVLAESYSVSDDGLTWTFNLREGVQFHDGSPFNAAAVKATVERTLAIGESPAGLWSSVEDISCPSEHQVVFRLKAPVPFDYVVAAGYGVFMISPTAVEANEQDGDLAQEWAKDHAVGTGPYRLKEWVRGQQMILEKFDDYYGEWKEGYPDIVVVKFVSEYSTARLMLEKGEADMVDYVPSDQIEDLQAMDGVTVETYPSFETLYFNLNCQKAPTDNLKFRQALCYAFNYDAIDEITGGNARPLRSILPSSMWGFSDNVKQYTFDLDKAEELLVEAGYADGAELTLGYMAQDELERQLSEMFKSDLSKIGVDLQLEGAPWATLRTNQSDLSTSYNILVRYWWPDYVDPHDFVYYLLYSGVPSNYAYYENAEVDRLIKEAHQISGVDREAAIAKYERIQQIAAEEAQSVFVLEQNWRVPMRTWVKNYEYNPAYPRIVKFYGLELDR